MPNEKHSLHGWGKPRMDESSHKPGGMADWSGYSSFDSTMYYRKSYGTITNNILCLSFDLVCHDAASEQDEIGWQNFAEGKISKSWGDLQLDYYHELHSKWSVDIWTSGLVSHLLELTHGMWIHRNGVDHVVDEQGLPFCLSLGYRSSYSWRILQGYWRLSPTQFSFYSSRSR